MLAGPNREDAIAWRLDLPGPRHANLGAYRIGTWLDDPAADLAHGVRLINAFIEERIRAKPEDWWFWVHKRWTDEVYAALGLPYIPPELRLGIGEIEAARAGTLPQVVELADIRGDFHMHCTWSDGRDTLEAMIAEWPPKSREALAALGWRVETIWECDLKEPASLEARLLELVAP